MPPCVAATVKISHVASSCFSDSCLTECKPRVIIRAELISAAVLQRVDTAAPCYMFEHFIRCQSLTSEAVVRKSNTNGLGFEFGLLTQLWKLTTFAWAKVQTVCTNENVSVLGHV